SPVQHLATDEKQHPHRNVNKRMPVPRTGLEQADLDIGIDGQAVRQDAARRAATDDHVVEGLEFRHAGLRQPLALGLILTRSASAVPDEEVDDQIREPAVRRRQETRKDEMPAKSLLEHALLLGEGLEAVESVIGAGAAW